jgi:hypothetical protein
MQVPAMQIMFEQRHFDGVICLHVSGQQGLSKL